MTVPVITLDPSGSLLIFRRDIQITGETMTKRNSNIKTAEIIVCALICTLILGTAAVCAEAGYTFSPEETMYLTGLEKAAYKEGIRYSLYDIDKDDTSELFIMDETENPGKLEIYRYDPSENTARLIFVLDDAAEVYGFGSENRLLAAFGAPEKGSYREFTIDNNILEEKTVISSDEAGYEKYFSDPDNAPAPLSWVGSGQWVDGSIIGVAQRLADPGFRNDFYLASNYEWLSSYHGNIAGDISGSVADLESTVSENKKMMFEDREKYSGTDIQLVRDYYESAVNWERREAEGIEPVKKYLDAAAGISSLSELTEFLTDPDLNPFCILLSITITLNEKDTSHWAAEIAEDNFSVLPRVYHNESREDIEDVRADFDGTARHVLSRAGCSAQDTEKIMAECYELEEILLPLAWPDEADEESPLYGFLPFDTVTSFCKKFPLKQLLNAYQISGGNIHVYYPGYLEQLDRLYTEENLSMLKSYIIAHTAAAAADYLDLEAVSCLYGGTVSNDELKTILSRSYQEEALSPQGPMSVAAENAYMTYFTDPETRADLFTLAEEIRDTFRERLSREDWMSDAGKAAAIGKLDNMAFSVMAPDVLIDSSYLAVDKDRSFLDNCAAIKVSRMKHNGAFAGKPREKGDWRYDLRSEIASSYTNAFYYGCFNQFFIFSGFVTDSIYRPDMPKEAKLAMLGEIIGHELTHGFDPTGIRYDKNGNMVLSDDTPYGWMPQEDYLAFMARAQKIADYFDRMRPFPYDSCPGSSQWGEAAADIGGLMIGLDIAGKIDGFDYDRYFRTYSGLWRTQTTLSSERSDIYNEHPLRHLRINVTLQQFDEFLNTYNVREGDGMFLDPDDRIRIW